MMSFKSRDLMIDVLPARKFNALAQPGLGMCAQGTANTGTEEDEERDCAQGTATNEPAYAPRTAVNLALLRQQLHEALSSTAQA
jgi:hypothetical protein